MALYKRERKAAQAEAIIPDSLRNMEGDPREVANALLALRTQNTVAGNDQLDRAIENTQAYKNLPATEQQRFQNVMQDWYAQNHSSGGGLLSIAKPSLNPFQQAKNVYRADQQNAGRVIEAMAPVVNKAIVNNPATMVSGTDKQAADALGWNWLSHMTGKTDQTFERTSNKIGGFQNLFERNMAEGMQKDQTYTLSDANQSRLDADRAHVRTSNADQINAGIRSGDYRVLPNGDVVDRYGASVLGKGLAQRGTTALTAASIVFPWLAPFAAAAQTATAYRHGAPAGKAVAQGVGSYYAGQLGGQYGGQLGGQVGAAAGQGAARGIAGGYAQGLRGGELLEAGALGGLSGGVGRFAGMQGSNPFLSGLYSGAARGAVSGYRQGDVGQGIQQGLLSGGLSGTGGLLAQQTGQKWLQPMPAMAYQRIMKG